MTLAAAGTDLAAAVDTIRGELPRWHVPGLELAAVRNGAVVLANGIGVRDIVTGEPATARTLFHHGSCGKAVTALLAALVAEDGLVDLDAPVRRYVPELRLADPVVADRVTTRDLLSHRSGIGRHDLAWIFNPTWSRDELVRRMEHLPHDSAFRTTMSYSNFGYALAGLVVARVTGSTWADQLRSRVFDPLGMSRSTTSVPRALADPDHATGHLVRDDKAVSTSYRIIESVAPAGEFMTCAEESTQWLLLHTGEALLSQSAVATTQRLEVAIAADASPFPELRLLGYALGWVVATYRGRYCLWHSGGVDGFSTYTLLLPDERIGVVASANSHLTPFSFATVLQVADDLLGDRGDESWFARLRPGDGDGTTPVPEQADAAPTETVSRPPVHALAAYTGTFTHPGYGALHVDLRDDALAVTVGEIDVEAVHRSLDTWALRYDPLDLDATLTFGADAAGTVADVDFRFDPQSAPVHYTRVPETRPV